MPDIGSSATNFLAGVNLKLSLDKILERLRSEYPEIVIREQTGRANYFGTSSLRSARFVVDFQGQKAHLKIRGDYPQPSEAQQLVNFARHNCSQIVTAPQLLLPIEWHKDLQFEGSLTQYVEGNYLINHSSGVDQSKVRDFFEIYREYRLRCAFQSWLNPPCVSLSQILISKYKSLFQVARTIWPDQVEHETGDLALIKDGLNVAIAYYHQLDDMAHVFGHGHFSLQDMVINSEGRVYLFSPTAWKWQAPYADAVFAYHWYMISLANASQLSSGEIESVAARWQKSILALHTEPSLLPGFERFNDEQRLIWIKLALLERLMAGVLVDLPAYCNNSMPHSEWLTSWFRQQLERTIKELKF